ncbi:uncharacterized protein LOC127079339 isoform X1 [Lathyrus oleraceus]|nr:uncharacterized protein LOC127079339 isoform X1 [Pisum sativum]
MDRDETMLPPHFRAYNSPLPTNPRLISVKKIKVCLMCGDKGDSKRLVFCIQCKACAQHSYCIENIHREDDGTIVWRCVDCAPSNPKCKPESARKSQRISYATEAKYKRIIMKKKSGTVRKQSLIRSKEGESVGCLAKNDAEKISPILKNEDVLYNQTESPEAKDPLSVSSVRSKEGESVGCLAKNDTEKILPVLKNEDVLCNHPESPDAKDPLNISCDKQAMKYEIYAEPEAINIMPQLFHYPEFDKYSRAQPLSDPVWGGLFRLNNATHFHLVAYLSSGASSKVKSAVTELPKLLDVESLSRHVIWPQSFVTYPPDNDCIGLYFFPQYERDEMIFDRVLNYAIEQDSALKAVINNLELFIFSSHLLPPDDRRICKKYYLWGVFKPKPRK